MSPLIISESFTETCLLDPVNFEVRPIGVDQPPGTGSNYPFVLPRNDEQKVLGDLFLRYTDYDCQFKLPFRVAWLFKFGCDPVYVDESINDRGIEEMLIIDADGEVVFDTRLADNYVRTAWGPRAWIISWQTDAAPAAGGRPVALLRAVRYKEDADDDSFSFPMFIRLDNGLLDGRTSQQTSLRVTFVSDESLSVGAGAGNALSDVLLIGGFNTQIDAETETEADGGLRRTTLTFHMDPGLGAGRYEIDCDEITNWGIKKINNVKPTSYQDFNITTEENSCTRVQRPWHELTDNSIGQCRSAKIRNAAVQIDSDCPPCCTCDDFISVYESVRRLSKVLSDYVARAHAVRDWLQDSIDRMDQQRECRVSSRLRAYVQSECPDKIAVSIAYCNSTQECIKNILIPISFQYEDTIDPEMIAITRYTGSISGVPGQPSEICGFTKQAGNVSANYIYQLAVPYVLGGKYPHYWAYFDAIEPYSMGFITFFVEFPYSRRGNTAKFIVDAYALPEPPLVEAQENSLPYITDHGYVIGSGPTSTLAPCIEWRLVTQPVIAGTGILQEPCCVEAE